MAASANNAVLAASWPGSQAAVAKRKIPDGLASVLKSECKSLVWCEHGSPRTLGLLTNAALFVPGTAIAECPNYFLSKGLLNLKGRRRRLTCLGGKDRMKKLGWCCPSAGVKARSKPCVACSREYGGLHVR